MNHETADPFGIYVHIPFCERKCPYCDFNSFATNQSDLVKKERRYVESILTEIAHKAEYFGLTGRQCSGIFFGGGTPTLLSSESLIKILIKIKEYFVVLDDAEITVEANPRSISESFSKSKLSEIFSGGFNRISIGAQSFDENKLKFLGRWHTPYNTVDTVQIARSAGFLNINLDLIFGVKDECLETWQSDLQNVITLEPTHISTYMLTLEPGTDFGRRSKRGEVLNVSDNSYIDMYELARRMLADQGYRQYEVSNFSKESFKCRHNLIYWQGGPYLGIGAGAHGFIKSSINSGLRYSNTPSPEVYSTKIERNEDVIQRRDDVSESELCLEFLLLGLRLIEGISRTESRHRFFDVIKSSIEKGKVDHLLRQGLLEVTDYSIRIPSKKFNLADGIISELYLGLS